MEVDSQQNALALQSRLSDINRNRFLPLIERVMDELDVPGRHIRIATLQIDLGTLPLDNFEKVAEERLLHELRQAIEQALRELDQGIATENRVRSTEEARLELLEYFLLHGTLPNRARQGATFDFNALFAEVAESSPDLLTSLVRKHGHQQRFLQRLVFQLDESLFWRLVQLLEPEHAALIIAYVVDLQQVHRVEPILELSDERYARHLRLLVLTYLVQERGSQFNRRSFVKSLLEGMAESEGFDYLAFIKSLHFGLLQTERKQRIKSSLPAVIQELFREIEWPPVADRSEPDDGGVESFAESGAGSQHSVDETLTSEKSGRRVSADALKHALAGLEHFLRTGQSTEAASADQRGGLRELRRLLTAGNTDRAVRLIRQLGGRGDPGRSVLVSRLLQLLSPQELLAVLAQRQDFRITDLIELICGASRGTLADGANTGPSRERGVRSAVLEFLLDAADGWKPRDLVLHVVEFIVGHDQVASLALVETAIGTLQHDSGDIPAAVTRALETVRRELRVRPAEATAKPVFRRYDVVESLRYYLRFGMLPWSALLRDETLTEEVLLMSLPQLPRSLLVAVFAADSSDGRLSALLRAVTGLRPEGLVELLAKLLPKTSQADSPFGQALAETASRAEDRPSFYARLIAAILDGRALDLEELATGTIQLASTTGILPDDPRDWSADAFKSAIVQQLRSGQPPPSDEHSLFDLLLTFMATHPVEARMFLQSLRAARDLGLSLVRALPETQFVRLLDTFCPQETQTLQAVLRTLSAIPSPYRPRPVDVRQLLLHGALRLDDGARLTSDFFAQMLRDLSGHGLAAETRRFLLSASSAWSSVRAESVADFQAAVTSFAGVPDAAESPAGTVPDDPRDWSADAFKSAIVQQLRSGAAAAIRRTFAVRSAADVYGHASGGSPHVPAITAVRARPASVIGASAPGNAVCPSSRHLLSARDSDSAGGAADAVRDSVPVPPSTGRRPAVAVARRPSSG